MTNTSIQQKTSPDIMTGLACYSGNDFPLGESLLYKLPL